MLDKEISYKITETTLLKISALERNIGSLEEIEITPQARARINANSVFDDLHSLSSHLKMSLTLGDIKRIAIGKDIDTYEARILSNVRQVFEFIKNNFKNKTFTFNMHLVQHIVKLLHTGVLEVWDIGRVRAGKETIDTRYELPDQKYYTEDGTAVLADAIQWVDKDPEVHPIIKATVFMMLMNNLSPFIGMNYISSLVFFRVILEKYRYSTSFSLPLFKLLTDSEIDLFKKIDENISGAGETNGITEIIETVSELMLRLIKGYKDDFVKYDYYDVKEKHDVIDINERQIHILKLLQQKVFIRRQEYVKLFNVAPMTAYRDLTHLVDKGMLKCSGQGKATIYTLP